MVLASLKVSETERSGNDCEGIWCGSLIVVQLNLVHHGCFVPSTVFGVGDAALDLTIWCRMQTATTLSAMWWGEGNGRR